MTEEMKAESFEYKAEMKQLLNLIIHSLYTHPEIFLRELISNASDALNKLRYIQLTDDTIIDKDKELQIRITLDEKEKMFSIEDNGVGMSKEELIENIGTVASSGTLEFIKKMKEENKNAGELIGQFGVGFYSTFMVTDKVTIETRRAHKDAKGYRWVSDGGGTY
ncbi:MAG: ATP-binding protein, partial [Endomicrobiales bacterium]